MTSTTPDLLIALGPRGLLSLLGAVVVISGVWYTDRAWDEKGSLAYERAKTSLLKAKPGQQPVVILDSDLNAAFPFPWAFLLGWVFWALANLFDGVDGSWQANARNLAAAVMSLAIGWIASVPMGKAVRFRDGGKKQTLSLLFVASWVLLTVLGGDESTTPVIFRTLGAVCIIASMKILWKFRKMGDTWERDGVPNPNPVVYNAGGPLFVLGWFLFWVGTAASSVNVDGFGVPIYFTARSVLAFVSGCGMVPVVLFLDYAHDEGAEFTGFGTDGRFFGRFLESPIPFLVAWTLFGVAYMFPFTDLASVTTLQWIVLANCVLQGIDAGVLIQTALYKGDMAGKNRWSILFVLLFLALATEIAVGGKSGLTYFSYLGAFLIILGQKTVFGDRKRGDYWMVNNIVNPNPIVYSAGEPIFMAGWIILWLTISIPTH